MVNGTPPDSAEFRAYATTGTPRNAAESGAYATTGTPRNAAESGAYATTGREARELSWRIEINRRESPEGYWFHWVYRLTLSDGRRKARYGGSLDSLPDPGRLKQYKRNSKRYARRINGQET